MTRKPVGTSDEETVESLTGQARGRLNSFLERIENLNQDKADVQSDIKDVFAEAKGEGFDVKIMRLAIRARAQDRAKRQEELAMLELYLGENDL